MTTPPMVDASRGARAVPWREDFPPAVDVAVVGGGFSGIVTLIHCCRLLPGRKLVLFERRIRNGPGPAYGACDGEHLLNVSAERMGALADDPGGFHRWLERRDTGRYARSDFVPRALFAEYLLDLLRDALTHTAAEVTLVRDAVVHVERRTRDYELLLGSGRSALARGVVLAPGLPPARPPWTAFAHHAPSGVLINDPWEPGVYGGFPRDAEVLIVGSGLTAIDTVLGLRRHGHRGVIHLLSRSGRLPLPHARHGATPAPALAAATLLGTPAQTSATLRRWLSSHPELEWQALIDAVRPQVAAIWRHWSGTERARFLRHARPLWDVHRHRAPRAVLDALAVERSCGDLTLRCGQLVALDASGDAQVTVTLRGRHRASEQRRVARVYNCVGPAARVADTLDPLLGALLRSGRAVADELGIGLRCDERGCVLDRDGAPDPRLLLVGALRRADLWESSAVPELRVLAARAAAALSAGLRDADPAPASCVVTSPRAPTGGAHAPRAPTWAVHAACREFGEKFP